jgi:hypothetical protein
VLKTINRSEWASPMFTVSKTYQTLRSITDLKEVNQKDCYKTYPILKVQKNKCTNCDSFNYNFFGHKHGILQNDIIPDYKVSRTINLWWRHIHVHHTTNEKYIQKVEELYFKTTTKSPRELVFERDMIKMSNILRIGSISAHVNNVLLRK